MRRFTIHRGIAVPLRQPNIDTDAIIPSREMKRVSKEGLAESLFAGWRYTAPGGREPTADFVLNLPEYAQSTIILGGRNFGCGSSREHAVWALDDFGIRVIIAPSFGSIFQKNCYRNGLLAVVLDEQQIDELANACSDDPEKSLIEVDLAARSVVSPAGLVYSFSLAVAIQQRMLDGADEIDQTLAYKDEIAAFARARADAAPWTRIAKESVARSSQSEDQS